MKIGRRIYYDTLSGDVLLDAGDRQGFVESTTIMYDIQIYKELSERNPGTFDSIDLEFGQYAQDFSESNGYRVNPETKKLEFSYPDPNEPEVEQPYQAPLSERINYLEDENADVWYNLLTAETEITNAQDEIANLWYEVMTI